LERKEGQNLIHMNSESSLETIFNKQEAKTLEQQSLSVLNYHSHLQQLISDIRSITAKTDNFHVSFSLKWQQNHDQTLGKQEGN